MNLLNALKNQKNLDVDLSGFVGNKDNSDIASKISYRFSRKIFKKIMKKINRLFYYKRHQ